MSESSETTRSTNVASLPSAQVPAAALPAASRTASTQIKAAETPRTARQTSPLTSQEVVNQLASSPTLAAKCSLLAAPERHGQDQLKATLCWIESDAIDPRSTVSAREIAAPVRETTAKRMRMEAISSLTSSSLTSSADLDPAEKSFGNDTNQVRIDQETKSAILRRLQQRLNQGARHISCDVVCGDVDLGGRVRSYYEMQLAQEAALRTCGVKSVINRIEVESNDLRD